MKQKKCIRCKELKNFEEFSNLTRNKGGKSNLCKKCDKKRRKELHTNINADDKIRSLLSKDCDYFKNNSKVCVSCEKVKILKLFPQDIRQKDTRTNVCKDCTNSKRKSYSNYEENKTKNRERYANSKEYRESKKYKAKIYRIKYNERVLLSQAKIRNKAYADKFDLVENDIEIPEKCPILNIKLERNSMVKFANSPSIDRVDNSKGYTKNNIRVISNLANTMKNKATKEQLILFAKNIENYLNGMI